MAMRSTSAKWKSKYSTTQPQLQYYKAQLLPTTRPNHYKPKKLDKQLSNNYQSPHNPPV